MGPAGQRQFREGAERYFLSCSGMVSRYKTSLKCTFLSVMEVTLLGTKIQIDNIMDIEGDHGFKNC